MKKIIIIITSLLVVCLVAFGLFYLYTQKQTGTLATSNNIDPIKPIPTPLQPIGDNFVVTTKQGNVVTNNFFKTATRIIEATVYIKETPNYVILYSSNISEFTISLYAYTPAEAQRYRQSAEYDFIHILGVSKDDACKLVVHETVPASFNTDLADDYHLSFCPNAINIPKS